MKMSIDLMISQSFLTIKKNFQNIKKNRQMSMQIVVQTVPVMSERTMELPKNKLMIQRQTQHRQWQRPHQIQIHQRQILNSVIVKFVLDVVFHVRMPIQRRTDHFVTVVIITGGIQIENFISIFNLDLFASNFLSFSFARVAFIFSFSNKKKNILFDSILCHKTK